MVPEEVADALGDSYRIEREIEQGGMATVYLAWDFKHRRHVAIKLMRPELVAAMGRARFLLEIEVVAGLVHPHIVPLFDSGGAGEHLFYVMPYIEGESLRVRLDREKQLPVEDAIRITTEVASALGCAHHNGIVHRDVKPGNVLITDGLAMLADFGVARVAPLDLGTDDTDTVSGGAGVVGTPYYMAPEQANADAPADGRADLYALGCVLFEMLAGRPPYEGTSATEVLIRHARDEIPSVLAHRPDLPVGLDAVFRRALAKSPSHRYPSVAHFVEELTLPAPVPGAVTIATGIEEVPTNLGPERTRFIGRERELDACQRALEDARLLTLTGIGGSGKTRVALRLARRMRLRFPDGVWIADLAPLSDAARLPLSIAMTLGLRETQDLPILAALTRHISRRRVLLVLDNCEHLLSACAEVADELLSGCPELRIIATSREGLGIDGERLIALRSMSFPAIDADRDVIEASESVCLFEDRARMVDLGFELDDAILPIVAEICRRLDGIPLAIELAAARVKLLSVGEILDKLGDRFRLLTGGNRALPRHQTLRAAIQWSYDNLDPAERRLLERLSVFVGGWTLSAASHVIRDDTDEFSVMEHLGRLVDKSLVVKERVGNAVSRYEMLETVRQYAAERVQESGDHDAARAAHLDYFLALTEADADEIGAAGWTERLHPERENLIAAHRWCDSIEGGAELGLRFVRAMGVYWGDCGLTTLGLGLAREALDRPGADARTRLRGSVLFRAAHLSVQLGQFEDARRFALESVSIAEELGDTRLLVTAYQPLVQAALGLGDLDEATRHAEASMVAARAGGSRNSIGRALNVLAIVRERRNPADAVPLLEESARILREVGNVEGLAVVLINVATIQVSLGNTTGARASLVEAAPLIEEAGGPRRGQHVLDVSAALASACGEWERAARFLGKSEALSIDMELQRDEGEAHMVAAARDRAREGLGDETFSNAEHAGRALSYDAAIDELRAWLTDE